MTGELANYAAYAGLYDTHTMGVPGDVDFYRSLALQAGGPIVEVGVGTARIALRIAAAGVRVIGLDVSPEMLAIAQAKARTAGPDVNERIALVRADMRRWALRRPVALVTIPFRTFLHNMTTEDQLSTLAAAHAALEPGGRLALNVFNPDITMIAESMRAAPATWHPRRGPGGGEEQRSYEPTAQVTRTTQVFRRANGTSARFSFSLRYVFRYEMEHLFARAGFEVEALFGDHFQSPFGELSTEMVWLVRRPA